jgi:acetyltransferase
MYGGSIEALYECDEIDIILPILLQRSALMRENVEAVRDTVLRCQLERGIAKPTYVCWVVGNEGNENKVLLQEAGIPVYEWPERTARAVAAIAAYAEAKRARAQQQALPVLAPAEARLSAASIVEAARAQGRTLLLESEVKALMAAFGARIPRETLCTSAQEAKAAAGEVGKPCVMKIVSPDISHKSDVGGVRVAVAPEEAGAAFDSMMRGVQGKQPGATIQGISVQEMVFGQEVMVGGLRDAEFGPMLLFGLGGVFVETLNDIAYRLLPAAPDEFDAMVHEIKGYPLLTGLRGRVGAKLDSLRQALQAAAWLMESFPEISELDLNPIFVSYEGAVVADGRAVLAAS